MFVRATTDQHRVIELTQQADVALVEQHGFRRCPVGLDACQRGLPARGVGHPQQACLLWGQPLRRHPGGCAGLAKRGERWCVKGAADVIEGAGMGAAMTGHRQRCGRGRDGGGEQGLELVDLGAEREGLDARPGGGAVRGELCGVVDPGYLSRALTVFYSGAE